MSGFTEEENGALSPPPLPVKKTPTDHWTTASPNSLVANGYVTTPRRRLATFDGGLGMDEEEGSVPEKPPLPAKQPELTPDLPPKSGGKKLLASPGLDYERTSSSPVSKLSISPSRSSADRSASATPPPIPEKPTHLVKEGSSPKTPARNEALYDGAL